MIKTPYVLLRFPLFLFLLFTVSCGTDTNKESAAENPVAPVDEFVKAPAFSGDSSFYFVEHQVNFGPRVPDTEPHALAVEYFVEKFEQYGAKVTIQEFQSPTYDGKTVNLKNIIATLYPDQTKRILLAAHYDSRPFASKDSVRQDEPFDAANDGASGVAVLLEIARVLHVTGNPPPVGVDIILFDGEDWGNEGEYVPRPDGLDSWWCLGSQYWAKNRHQPNYTAYYGILLDMVGGKDAKFFREGYSMQVAPKIVNKVWETGARLGHNEFFIPAEGGTIEDDHRYVNQYTNIPMIDIIPMDPTTRNIGDFHHTHGDNISIIDPETLKAVGETVLHVLYNER